MTSSLAAAVWQGICPNGTPKTSSSLVRQRYARAVLDQAMWLRDAAADGVEWLPALLGEAEQLAKYDARFAFVTALPRSALFGEVVINAAIPPGAGEEARNAGRLINVFVTCLDGICDETPELLPATLPYLEDLLTAMPGPLPNPPSWRHPAVGLTHNAAVNVARILLTGPTTGSKQLTGLVTTTTRTAYRRQIETLRMSNATETAHHRTDLSVATFAVTLLAAAVFRGLTLHEAQVLVQAAGPLGALFGWIDDVVDLESDRRRGLPNLAALLANASTQDPLALSRVTEETALRWAAVTEVRPQLAREGVGVANSLEDSLRDAAFAWLGFPSDAAIRQ